MGARVFLATTGPGLARARRIGDDWSVDFLLDDEDARCLAADPLDPNVVYVGTQGHGLWRSDDGGGTWRRAGLAGQIVKAVAVSRSSPGTVYAGTKPALLYVSHDGGDSWTELTSFRRIRSRWFWLSPAEKPFTAYVYGIALSPTDPDVLVVGIEFGAVVRSTDGGQTWSDHRPGAMRDCHSLIFHPPDGRWVYEGGGSGGGAAVSHDAGETWQQPKSGLDRHYGLAVAADPVRPEVWYVSLSTGPFKPRAAIFRSSDFRASNEMEWEKLSGGLPEPLDQWPYALATDPNEPGHVYAGLSNGHVWHSTDHGANWRRMPFDLKSIQRSLIILTNE